MQTLTTEPTAEIERAPDTARASGAPMRILIASHSHPEVSNGGAEIAAFQLFQALRSRADCRAWFLGCDRNAEAGRLGAVLSQPFSDDEYIYGVGAFDWFKFANPDPRFRTEIERLFVELAPDVVHFHHYINFGVEAFCHLKRVRPDCRIVLTLHEYLAICHHFGQMVTKPHNTLCYQSGPARCQTCFPEVSRADFYLRRRYIERFFDLVDVFISPSQFLAERYLAWGVPADKMVVLENLMPPPGGAPADPPLAGPLRIGFFGQISSLKGIDVLFDTAAILATQEVSGISLEVHGDYRGQPPQFQAAFLERLGRAGSNIRFNGPYDRQRVDQLMQSVHAVVVPSVWWENSPVVIQEAIRNRRPVICSDVGGMAEKVRDGVDGFHFSVGNATALAALLQDLALDHAGLAKVRQKATAASPISSTVEDFLAVYEGTYCLRGGSASRFLP